MTPRGGVVRAPEAQLSPGQRVVGGPMSGSPTALEEELLAVVRDFNGGSVTIADLALGMRVPRREIEIAIQHLREAEHPIVAGGHGVRYIEDPGVLYQYIQARRRRMLSEWKGTVALKKTLRRMRERADLTLWDVA